MAGSSPRRSSRGDDDVDVAIIVNAIIAAQALAALSLNGHKGSTPY